jgi:hypothetical protein
VQRHRDSLDVLVARLRTTADALRARPGSLQSRRDAAHQDVYTATFVAV